MKDFWFNSLATDSNCLIIPLNKLFVVWFSLSLWQKNSALIGLLPWKSLIEIVFFQIKLRPHLFWDNERSTTRKKATQPVLLSGGRQRSFWRSSFSRRGRAAAPRAAPGCPPVKRFWNVVVCPICKIYLRIFKRRDCIWCVTCLFQYVTVLTTVATICQRGIPPLVTSLLLYTVENHAWTKM